jgi:hypothetical protein
MAATNDGTILSICGSNNYNATKRKRVLKKKIRNIGRGVR